LIGLAAVLPGVSLGAPNVLGMRVIAAIALALLAAAAVCRLRAVVGVRPASMRAFVRRDRSGGEGC
jgi:hypothetical protein